MNTFAFIFLYTVWSEFSKRYRMVFVFSSISHWEIGTSPTTDCWRSGKVCVTWTGKSSTWISRKWIWTHILEIVFWAPVSIAWRKTRLPYPRPGKPWKCKYTFKHKFLNRCYPGLINLNRFSDTHIEINNNNLHWLHIMLHVLISELHNFLTIRSSLIWFDPCTYK